MLRRVFTGVLAGGLSLLLGGTAMAAAPPQTETITTKHVVDVVVDVNPSCVDIGPLYEITTTTNSVTHYTVFADGRAHVVFTETGTFTAVPFDDPSLPSTAGKFTETGTFNDNGRGVVTATATFSIRGTGSDGSTFSRYTVDHFNATPPGAEFFVTHCHG
jgi:hypothetical protein